MSSTDDQLIAQLRAGDRAALAEFIERRRPQLLAFIERSLSDRLRQKVESGDILQEVSISALDSLADVDLGERDPFSWLCQLAERRIIDAHRRHFGAQKRSAARESGLEARPGAGEPRGLIDLLVASITSPSQAFSRGEREFELLQALESLPEDSRTALKLRYVEGLPSKEIAARLGRTDGAVRVLLTRSLAKLQEMLKDNPAFQSFLT